MHRWDWAQLLEGLRLCEYPRHKFYLIKSFKLLSLSGKLANLILATLVSLHYNIYINGVKLATSQLPKMAKISAEEYFVCVG